MAVILNERTVQKLNYKNKTYRTMKVYKNHDNPGIFSVNEQLEIREIDGRKIRLTMSKKSPRYDGSAAQALLLSKIEDCLHKCKAAGITSLKQNISHYPAGAENLFDYLRMDITARILDLIDLTPYICNTVQNDAYTDPFWAQWFYKYAAPFFDFTGRGDPVNLVQIKTGDRESIHFTFSGVGFEQDLYNQLFNNIFEATKITQAVAEGYTLRKNDIVFNPVFTFAYPANKLVPAVTTGTYEENIYETLQNALDTLGVLLDFQTQTEIDISNVSIICHSTRVRRINRAINGQLQNGSQVKNLTPISEITRIIPYNSKHIYYGNKDILYQGCGVNDFYMFVPQMYYWLALKRDLTHVTGPGDTFGITSMREAWYFVWSILNTQFFGGDESDPETSEDPAVMTQQHGYIIHGTLPTSGEET